jgi:AraC family transcriptional activator FtrA
MTQPGPLIVALVYNGVSTFELGTCIEVFGLPRPEFDFSWYRFAVCAGESGKIAAVGGIFIEATGSRTDLLSAHTIIIPGWRSVDGAPSAELLELLRAAAARGTRLISVSGGVFLLAAAGLLDGRRVSTHWMLLEALRARHPHVLVDTDALYVDEGHILTSAGSAACIDLCLHVVRKDFGARVANRVARRLIAQPHREGGQSQYTDRPLPEGRDGRIGELLDWMGANLGRDIHLSDIALRARMSERTLLRRFRTATGLTPKLWLLRERVRRAQQILEATDLSMEQVAHESGFGSTEAFRYHFRRITDSSPTSYRLSFRGQAQNERLAGQMADTTPDPWRPTDAARGTAMDRAQGPS